MRGTAELKACPFCGEAAYPDVQNDDELVPRHLKKPGGLDHYQVVWCDKCGAEGGKRLSPATAVAAWNRRTPPPPTGEQSEREELARVIDDRTAARIGRAFDIHPDEAVSFGHIAYMRVALAAGFRRMSEVERLPAVLESIRLKLLTTGPDRLPFTVDDDGAELVLIDDVSERFERLARAALTEPRNMVAGEREDG